MSDTTPDAVPESAASEPTAPAFDLRAFLAAKDHSQSRPTKYVSVVMLPGLEADILAVDQQLADAQAAYVADDRPMASASDILVLQQRADDLREKMRASRLAFKFAALERGAAQKLKDEHGLTDDDYEFTYRILAAQCVEPAGLTWEDFATLRELWGDAYWAAKLVTTANSATNGADVAIPFSSSTSESPTR